MSKSVNENFIECTINKTSIYYKVYGQGIPILCLHGVPEDHRAVKNSIEPIFTDIKGYRRIYIDLPGMGRTGAIQEVRCANDMLELLSKFIEKVIGNEYFLLVGQSYGGYLALGLLYHMRNKIKGLFFICPCFVPNKEKRNLPLKNNTYVNEEFLRKYEKEDSFKDFLEYTTVTNEETWSRYKEDILPGLMIADSAFIHHYQTEGYEFSFGQDLKDIEFNYPVTILTGKQDNCVGYQDVLDYISNFENITFSIIDNAGHNLQIEHEELFNNNVEEWLKRIELFSV